MVKLLAPATGVDEALSCTPLTAGFCGALAEGGSCAKAGLASKAIAAPRISGRMGVLHLGFTIRITPGRCRCSAGWTLPMNMFCATRVHAADPVLRATAPTRDGTNRVSAWLLRGTLEV